MTAIPGYSDKEIRDATEWLESRPVTPGGWAYVALAAIRQCQANAKPDDGYIYAPTPQQIIDHLAVGGMVEHQTWYDGSWILATAVRHGDVRGWRGEAEPRRGLRLAPIKPYTEWVPFLRALGRISAKFPAARFEKVIKDRRNGAIVIVTDTSRTVEPDSHAMVEVLSEDDE